MHRRALAAVGLSAALAALAGCGADATKAPPPPPAEAWLDVPGMTCADGSGTGIWISRGASDDVLVVLSGGGACWSADRCPVNVLGGFGVLRRFGASEFSLFLSLRRGSILDRTVPGNPFAGWTFVFVPYCTGDVHAGGGVTRSYDDVSWRHRGYANLEAAIARMAQELPRPAKVVVSGFSAGGFGSLLALDLVHAAWDPGYPTSLDAALVDDSGPTFVGTAMPSQLLSEWWDAWNLGSTLGTSCPGCAADLSQAWVDLHGRHPLDRLALLSTTRDSTMRYFFGLDANTPMGDEEFAAGLDGLCARLADQTFDGAGGSHRAACFRVDGDDHALLWNPAIHQTSGGTTLLGWLGKLAGGASDWVAAGP